MSDKAFQEILNKASIVTESPHIALFLLDHERSTFVVKAVKGGDIPAITRGLREARRILPGFSPEKSVMQIRGNRILERLLRTKKTIVIHDIAQAIRGTYPDVLAKLGQKYLRSRGAILSPLLIQREVGGLMAYLYRRTPTRRDILIAEAFANQVSLLLAEGGLVADIMKTEKKYRTIFHSSPIAIYLLDRKGVVVDTNAYGVFRGIGGKAEQEASVGKNMIEDSLCVQSGLSEYLRQLISGHRFDIYNFYFPATADREEIYANVRGVPLFKDENEVENALVLLEVITEKHRLQQRLRESEERLKELERRSLDVWRTADLDKLTSRYGLSKREIEVVRLIVAGFTNKEIAAKLFISPYTANTHIQHILQKVGAKNRVTLLRKVLSQGENESS